MQKKIIAGLNSLDVGITHLDVLRGEASNMSPTISKYLDDELQRRKDRIGYIQDSLFKARVIDVKEDEDQ